MNLLIVDDSSLTRKAMQRILEMVDLDVEAIHEAEDGREAISIMLNQTMDLVLADLNMPGMGGIEMIAHMQEHELMKTIPVIIISTESSTTRIEGLLAQGARNYLHKPFRPESVKDVIEKTLGVNQP